MIFPLQERPLTAPAGETNNKNYHCPTAIFAHDHL